MNELQIAPVLARWCSLTYEDAIVDRALDFGIPDLRIVTSENDEPVLAVVGTVGEWLVVAFSGTVLAGFSESSEKWRLMLAGMLYNVGGAIIEDPELLEKVKETYEGGTHLGFAYLLDEVWPEIEAFVAAKGSDKQLWLTGHSLGGALASLAAYRLQRAGVPVAGVMTFGSPRVLDASFAQSYRVDHYRFEHRNDVVPFLPPGEGLRDEANLMLDAIFGGELRLRAVNYRHVGKLRYINAEGEVEEASDWLEAKRVIGLVTGAFRDGELTFFRDHGIDSYSRALHRLNTRDFAPKLFRCRTASAQELDHIIQRDEDMALRFTAIQEIARRGFAPQSTYEWLQRCAALPSVGTNLNDGQRATFDALRQNCLWALSMLCAIQYLAVPVEQLGLLPIATRILQDPRETSAVKAAAVWALVGMNRLHDSVVRVALAAAANQSDEGIKQLARDGLASKLALPPRPAQDVSWLARYRMASAAELNQILAAPLPTNAPPPVVADKITAINELYWRGFGDAVSYELLVDLLLLDTSRIPLPLRIPWDDMRRHSLWTLGLMNRTQNALVPTRRLPGLAALEQILRRQAEHLIVKLAAIESLWLLDRAQDRHIRAVLRIAAQDPVQAVRRQAELAASGRGLPPAFPSAQISW